MSRDADANIMRVEKLALTNFRNYRSLELDVSPGVTFFIGDNGQGKTNLIEAIYVLLKGTSFRTHHKENLIYSIQNEQRTKIFSEIKKDNRTFDIKMILDKSKKELFINDKKAKTAATQENFPLVLFSPESLSAVKEGPEVRRSLVDDLIAFVFPEKIHLLYDFKKILMQRNKLLRDYRDGLQRNAQSMKVLESHTEIFLRLASELTSLRVRSLETLTPLLDETLKSIMNSQNVDISVDYVMSGNRANGYTYEQIYHSLRDRERQLHSAELESGVSLVGPHKHDISFLWNCKDSRFYCSQGQQRALILAFKMAQINYHENRFNVAPLLLLDDVLSELDSERRSHLVSYLQDLKSQIFLTSTEPDFARDLKKPELKLFKIQQGSIS